MKKRHSGSVFLAVVLFLAGLSLLLYPIVSNYWNSLHQTRAINTYSNEVEKQDKEENDRRFAAAQDYNARLTAGESKETLLEDYDELLNPAGDGIMAYLEIPVIDCTLPIVHGTDDHSLNTKIGHLEWSSLPVGGTGTHSVVSGHRGLPSAELLTNLDRVGLGDVFYIHVLDRILQYRVDQIWVVEPWDTRNLQIDREQDYVTLVTCTPYGINSHRLLVRGTRVLTGDAYVPQKDVYVPNEVVEVQMTSLYFIAAILAAVVTFFAVLFYTPIRRRNTGGKRLSEKETTE